MSSHDSIPGDKMAHLVNGFRSRQSLARKRRMSMPILDEGSHLESDLYTNLNPMWAGIACSLVKGGAEIEVAFSIHDSVYSTDFATAFVAYDANDPDKTATTLEQRVIQTLTNFSKDNLCKFVGVGISHTVLKDAPNLCTRLWLSMDIIPIVFNIKPYQDNVTKSHVKQQISSGSLTPSLGYASHSNALSDVVPMDSKAPLTLRTMDEQADAAARKSVMYFGPNGNPRLSIGLRNIVEVDSGGKIHLIDDLDEFRKTVRPTTWRVAMKLADELRQKKVKIAFFSSTPQGGGVALMRHALIRFFTAIDVDASWYVPNPSPKVFRTTKNNHNILQGVAAPDLRLTPGAQRELDAWITKNGLRWTSEGGPLAPGGCDLAVIDDPQMPGLIPLIKKVRPNLPIIYRSHIEIRSDLVKVPGSPQEEVWKYLWNNIKMADTFLSHPVKNFVPQDVPAEILALQGAATDWLDGLNKPINPWDTQYYMGEFKSLCSKDRMYALNWPTREYFVQIARFDPSKGIPNVIDSYAKFRKILQDCDRDCNEDNDNDIPQLLITGHSSVDDPDGSTLYDEVMHLIETQYKEYAKDMVIMRLPPSDQMLNVLLANSKVALQLSTREGFEVKVSEALHFGIPVIASNTGGIPLQIDDGKSGYITEPGDNEKVAELLFKLYTDDETYAAMSTYAKHHVSDEVSTVGNACSWMYLAAKYSRGEKLKPQGRWLNDMLREDTNEPYAEGEPKLHREGLIVPG